MKIIFFLLLLPFALLAQEGFELPPTLGASAILKPEFVSGAGFTVREPVSTFSGRNRYIIDSDAGLFTAEGNGMLLRRLREIAAILKLRKVSRTDEYRKALASAVASRLVLAKGVIENPVGAVTGVPAGLWKFLNSVGQSVKETGQNRKRGKYEDSNVAEMAGFAKVKRDVALKLGVDPYSSNEELQKELNGISWAAYAGKMTFELGTAPVSGGAGQGLTSTGWLDAFSNASLDQSPSDLRLASLKRLLAMGCTRGEANAFLNNPAFSPSVQTALVMDLVSLKDVADRACFIRLAGSQSQNEVDALFFADTASLLAKLHDGGHSFARIAALGSLPIAVGADGTVIAGLEWDYASWTQNAADFIEQLKAAKVDGNAPAGFVVALSGDASPMVQEKLKEAGIALVARVAPGPLQ